MSEERFQRVEVIAGVARRRRRSADRKLRSVEESLPPGESVSSTARRYGVAPHLLYRWRFPMSEGGARALQVQADDGVTGNGEVRRLEERVRALERHPGRKALEVEILQEALAKSQSKTDLAVLVAAEGSFPVKAVADSLSVSRSNLVQRLASGIKPRRRYSKAQDAAVLAPLRPLVDARPSSGYRRITALLNHDRSARGETPFNHKRLYRIMKHHDLLLEKHSGTRPGRCRNGKVVVMRSDLRRCSDGPEFTCRNGGGSRQPSSSTPMTVKSSPGRR